MYQLSESFEGWMPIGMVFFTCFFYITLLFFNSIKLIPACKFSPCACVPCDERCAFFAWHDIHNADIEIVAPFRIPISDDCAMNFLIYKPFRKQDN